MASKSEEAAPLTFFGHEWLRERVLLSVLSGKNLRIRKIRASSVSVADQALPGLQPYEASFLRLVCRLTSGSELSIDATGTSLSFKPGVLRGVREDADAAGKGSASASASSFSPVLHVCHEGRGISYFLEPLVLLSAFSRFRMHVVLKGVTDAHPRDPSVDLLRLEMLPLLNAILKRAGGAVAEAASAQPAEVRVLTRGLPEAPFGLVSFRGPGVARGELAPLKLCDPAAAKARVRGIAFAAGASPALARRAVSAARGVLNAILPDVWVAVEVPPPSSNKAGKIKKPSISVAPSDAPLEKLVCEQREAFNRSESKALVLCLAAEGVDGFVCSAEASLLLALPASSAMASCEASRRLNAASAASDASRALGSSKIVALLEAQETEGIQNGKVGLEDDATESSRHEEAEALGVKAARHLLLQLMLGSTVSPRFASLPILFAALAEEYAPSTILLSRLLPSGVAFLRLVRDFFGVAFSFKEIKQRGDSSTGSQELDGAEESAHLDLSWSPLFQLTCVGVGFKNLGLSSF